jgi:hypothetical protein
MDGAGALLEIDVSMRGDTPRLELSGEIDLSTKSSGRSVVLHLV